MKRLSLQKKLLLVCCLIASSFVNANTFVPQQAKSLPKKNSALSAKTSSTKKTQAASMTNNAPVQIIKDSSSKKTKKREPKGELVDGIEVVIYGDEGTQIITKADLNRLSIDGQARTKEEIILERLMFLDAQKMHMVQGDEAVDTYLNTIMRENNLSRDQLESLFEHSGYSYEEAREQLRIMYAVNSIIDFKIRSRLIVPEKDVQAYFKSHPVLLEPTFQLQRAVIPLPSDESDGEAFKQKVALWCAENKGDIKPEWSEAFWVDKGELAADKMFIATMQKGSCAVGGLNLEGVELFKLVDKKDEREQVLEERYREIVDILRRPKFEELFNEYKKQLKESASIVYF